MLRKVFVFLMALVMLFLTACGGYRESDVMKVVGDTSCAVCLSGLERKTRKLG